MVKDAIDTGIGRLLVFLYYVNIFFSIKTSENAYMIKKRTGINDLS